MTLESKIDFPETVFAQMVDDEMVLLDTLSGEYFGLEGIGAVIWQHMSKNESLREVFETMLEMYEVEAEKLENDIVAFVKKLLDAGLVKLQA